VSRNLYPILLSISIVLAIVVYQQPSQARKWIRQAQVRGSELLGEALHTTAVLAEEARSSISQPGYASTNPAAGAAVSSFSPYDPSATQDPSWTYVADGNAPAANPRPSASPPWTPNGYSQPAAASSAWNTNGTQSSTGPATVYPRVLANGSDSGQSTYPSQLGQPIPPYPASGQDFGQTGSTRVSIAENPLRASMPREAPWDTTAGSSGGSALPPVTSYQEAQPQPQIGAAYPKVQWAGDWRDYHGVPETVKPADQSQYGFLPPPDVDTTAADVNRYLPNQPPAQTTAQQTVQPSYPPGQVSSSSPAHPSANPYPYAPPVQQLPAVPGGVSVASGRDVPVPRGAQMESPDPVADFTLCEGAQILARVGSEIVLASEVLPVANETLSTVEGIEKESERNIALAREQLVRRMLPGYIDMKLLYVDAKRTLPPEAIENINKQLGKRFEEVEVAERLKKLKLNSRRELEEKLKQWGSSLEREKQAFIEKSIAQQWVFEKSRKEEEISHEELLGYYQAHATEYEHPTRVRWEHLEVTFSRHPDKREAWQLIATMGNAVQQGQPLDKVAKERSEGIKASQGGQNDWLTQGSLKSEVLDRALFSLPVRALSPILEDETGFHIVRVVEREDAHRTPFEEMQGEIRERLQEERKEARLKEFLEKLREEIPVSTVFDGQTADSRSREALSSSQAY